MRISPYHSAWEETCFVTDQTQKLTLKCLAQEYQPAFCRKAGRILASSNCSSSGLCQRGANRRLTTRCGDRTMSHSFNRTEGAS